MTQSEEIKKLSKRQLQCVKLYADGLPQKAVAALLKISLKTVGYHMGKACKALGFNNRVRLIKWAFVNGLSPL